MTTLYRPTSARDESRMDASAPKYIARVEEHDFALVRMTGPRGGDLGYAIFLPGGALDLNVPQGEQAAQAREARLQQVIERYMAEGWTPDRAEAERLAEIHARARSKTRPTTGGQRERTAARLRAADLAVATARQIQVGSWVCGGEGEDYDEGVVLEIHGATALVAWDLSQVRTPVDIDAVEPMPRPRMRV